jgi:hypothetical protein
MEIEKRELEQREEKRGRQGKGYRIQRNETQMQGKKANDVKRWNMICQSQGHFTADSRSVCLGVEPTSWTFEHILLPFQRVWVWNLLSCLCGAPSLTRSQVCPLSVTV